MLRRPARLLIGLALLAGSRAAPALHPLITEDASTQGAGNFQVELNAEWTGDAEGGTRTRARQLGTLLSIGLAGTLDLVVSQPRLRITTTTAEASRDAEGAGDLALDLKWRFYEKGSTSFALKPGFTVPAGDPGAELGNGAATYALFLVGSFEQPAWTLHTHAGYKANRNRLGQPVDVVHLSAAAVVQASARVKLVADVALDTDFGLSLQHQPAWLVLGAIWSPTRTVDLDLGVKLGLNRVAPDAAALGGVTMRW